VCSTEKAALITGSDRSGKSVIAKKMQDLFAGTVNPAILISGKKIRNKDIQRLANTVRNEQFETSEFPMSRFRVIVDNFDECPLPDGVKEVIIKRLCENYHSCILLSFSNAPSVLFTSGELPNPIVFLINPITDAKLYTLVQKWLSIGLPAGEYVTEDRVLPVFEKIQLVFEQTGLDKAPHTAATFLQFIDTVTGSDISFSSYAACYEMLIGARLAQANISIQAHDEARNFLALVAYRSYAESGSACLSRAAFEESLAHFEEQFLSSKAALRKMAVGPFLTNEDFYQFHEEYLWYFLCARYAVKSLQVQDQAKYVEFVRNCTANIFQRKFANIAIFIAYFSNDKLPFINAKIGDSENIDNLEVAIDRDSYIRSVNALLRTHRNWPDTQWSIGYV